MTAYQTYPVNDKKQVIIQLPNDFNANEVAITWRPILDEGEQRRKQLVQMVRSWDVSEWEEERVDARDNLIEYLLTEWNPNGARVMDMLEPFVEEVDWAMEPLSQEMQDYFYGSLTDEYGITLEGG